MNKIPRCSDCQCYLVCFIYNEIEDTINKTRGNNDTELMLDRIKKALPIDCVWYKED